MAINFPANTVNNQIYVANNGTNWIFSNTKNVWSVVSQSTYQVSVATTNVWVNPTTSNTMGMYQVSGAKKIEVAPYTNIVHNTISLGAQTLGYNASADVYYNLVTIPRSLDANTDALFCNLMNSSVTGGSWDYANVYIGGVLYTYGNDVYFNELANSEFYIFQVNVPDGEGDPLINIAENDPINISFDFRPSQPWFDPAELGFTNFKGAKISYHAYIDGANGFSEICDFYYVRPRFDRQYEHDSVTGTRIITRNGTPGDLTDYDHPIQDAYMTEFYYNDNKVYFSNWTHPNYAFSGNLHIQWTGTVWTTADK
jgi:hypothetical protein